MGRELRRRSNPGRAHSVARLLARVGVETPDVAAGLLHVLLVPQLPVGLHQLHQRVGRDRGPRVGGDHVLEVEDGGVVGLELEVIERRAVLLVREALLQLGDPRLGPGGRAGAGVAVEQLLVGGERGLAVGRDPAPAGATDRSTRHRRAAAHRAPADRWGFHPTSCGTRARLRGGSRGVLAPRRGRNAPGRSASRPAGNSSSTRSSCF